MKYRLLLIIGLVILLPLVAIICLAIGGTRIDFSDLSDKDNVILWQVRLPRILGALLVGAGLAVGGCVLQGILRNPLAEPYTLGISGGAALGVTLALIAGASGSFGTPAASFIGAILTVGLVYLIASRHRFSVSGLILGGVILSFIFSGCVMLVFAVAKPTEIQSAMFWLMGNLFPVDYPLLGVIAPLIIIGIIVVIIFARDLDVLALGDEKAVHLGVSSVRVRQFLFIITSLITAACVALAGVIGFVGLMIPHIMRLMIGPQHRALIITSALGGAIFLALADTLARSIIAPYELPVGVITGIIGGVFFIGLLMRKTV